MLYSYFILNQGTVLKFILYDITVVIMADAHCVLDTESYKVSSKHVRSNSTTVLVIISSLKIMNMSVFVIQTSEFPANFSKFTSSCGLSTRLPKHQTNHLPVPSYQVTLRGKSEYHCLHRSFVFRPLTRTHDVVTNRT